MFRNFVRWRISYQFHLCCDLRSSVRYYTAFSSADILIWQYFLYFYLRQGWIWNHIWKGMRSTDLCFGWACKPKLIATGELECVHWNFRRRWSGRERIKLVHFWHGNLQDFCLYFRYQRAYGLRKQIGVWLKLCDVFSWVWWYDKCVVCSSSVFDISISGYEYDKITAALTSRTWSELFYLGIQFVGIAVCQYCLWYEERQCTWGRQVQDETPVWKWTWTWYCLPRTPSVYVVAYSIRIA